jgi:hypothetical protein
VRKSSFQREYQRRDRSDPALVITQSDESGKSGVASGKRNRGTTGRLVWRTPSSGTNRSLATAFGLVIPSHKRLKRSSPATF